MPGCRAIAVICAVEAGWLLPYVVVCGMSSADGAAGASPEAGSREVWPRCGC
jgi:hypothetical protein